MANFKYLLQKKIHQSLRNQEIMNSLHFCVFYRLIIHLSWSMIGASTFRIWTRKKISPKITMKAITITTMTNITIIMTIRFLMNRKTIQMGWHVPQGPRDHLITLKQGPLDGKFCQLNPLIWECRIKKWIIWWWCCCITQ